MKSQSDRSFSIVAISVRVLLLALLFMLPLWARCLFESYRYLEVAAAAQQRGDARGAIEAYARSVRWRAPGNFYAIEAHHTLRSMTPSLAGEDLIFLLKELRRALFMTRSLYTEHEEELDEIREIDRKLVALGARLPKSGGKPEAFRPDFSWQLVSQLGFWAWIASVIAIIRLAFSASGKLLPMRLIVTGGLSLLAFAFWLLALSQA